ncbi:beta-glucan-binding protein [Striga asiatica]|uniref:glucan endo-1,3-beta-D-glucosidase n=1 Tax=Striga asiatica TaxID=4170 RepID=A0A5A7PTX2_STRAF|nr:beta-glucan-binding protein [Striga asiatica]
MLKKIRRRVKIIVTKPFRPKPRKTPPAPPPPSSTPPPPIPDAMSPPQTWPNPFLFPQTHSAVLPDPSPFFAPDLLSAPLPTNSFFQNLVLKNGDQPEYLHPYLVRSSESKLTICYPSLSENTSAFFYQIFVADIIVSTVKNPNPSATHMISKFNDLSVTLDFPSTGLRFYLVRGSPFVTCKIRHKTALSISTVHAILALIPNGSRTRYTIKLNNSQTWLLYASSSIDLSSSDVNTIISTDFSGLIRIAALPNDDPKSESVLDRFSSSYPVSGEALFDRPFSISYRWDKRGWGDLLILAHPLHLRFLSENDSSSISVLHDFKYNSVDGELVGIVGDSWVLKTEPISITWHSIKGIKNECYSEITDALDKDVEALNSSSISTTSSYFYGKLIARAARLALIAEEISHPIVIPVIKNFLKETIEPWLEGTFGSNGFLYDSKWGGIVTKQGSFDSGADFGFGLFNDHHYHIGYFLYAIAVLVKIDPSWGRKYKPQAYSLVADFMNMKRKGNSGYPRLRCFDLYKLHSWAGGLTEFADGRNQESTSEAVNAYYSAALMGLAYGDTHLVSTGSTLTAFEIEAAKMWWHVREDSSNNLYPKEFVRENCVVGVLWSSKRDSGLWFAPPEWRECRLGIQLLPLLPVSEVLFSDVRFVKELVEWVLPALNREGVGEGWKGFVYALRGVYDIEGALESIRNLKGHDDGNSCWMTVSW